MAQSRNDVILLVFFLFSIQKLNENAEHNQTNTKLPIKCCIEIETTYTQLFKQNAWNLTSCILSLYTT